MKYTNTYKNQDYKVSLQYNIIQLKFFLKNAIYYVCLLFT